MTECKVVSLRLHVLQ